MPPKENGVYFVRRQENIIPTARVFNDSVWHSHDTILYWMPIPPLPEKLPGFDDIIGLYADGPEKGKPTRMSLDEAERLLEEAENG